MNLREINFSFGGLHCLRDFGCIYVEDGGHPVTPPARRNNYEIAGVSGTVTMPGVTYDVMPTFDGSLYFIRDLPNQQAAQENLRKIAAWLMNGRQRLIFDYEPSRYYMAEMNGASEWGYSGWIEGGLKISFEAQPYAYNVHENVAVTNTTGTSATLTLTVDTDKPAPLKIEVKNTGTASIGGLVVSAMGKTASLTGMTVVANTSLVVDMEPPIGAQLSTGMSAMPYVQRFDYIELMAGKNLITVTLTYGSGTRGAKITASARGRY